MYIRYMGIEAYGLVGLFTILQALSSVLDLGLTTTLNRELARNVAMGTESQGARDLVRTLELVYWMMAALIAASVILLAGPIARHWVRPEQLPPQVVTRAVVLMGSVLAFQWPLGFYGGGLLGLQRQVTYNVLNSLWYTLRFAGAALVMWQVSPTVTAFFTWQVLVSFVSTALTAWALWRALPEGTGRAAFRMERLRSVGGFATGLSAISITVLLLTQADKVVLSRTLSLQGFGYYSLAGTVSGGLALLSAPIFTAFFPTFSQQVVRGDSATLARSYHLGCQLVSVVILPVAAILGFFGADVLQLWTRSPTTVESTHRILRLLVLGTALNGLVVLPYALQLAHGWTRLAFVSNLLAIALLVPALVLLARTYGAQGAAAVWATLNAGYVLIQVHFMHRRLLPQEKWKWYRQDVGMPFIASTLVVAAGRFLPLNHGSGSLAVAVRIAMVGAAAFVAATMAAPILRTWVGDQAKRLRSGHAPSKS
ncbi:MAG: oligosaccharide flippase family protein [Polyangiaceae bacterium]